ncbi:uncharacterized protein LOC103134706 [Poecilia formosa]|uniref:uncharacterized protein LOC103134706 n=1 Tax=Poecilia formosa TaxID=48698 RepID=UPI00044451D1|nr:PREDICTED: uncharacterized protein LOC103134706 [Poecilia formosa]
MGFPGPTNITLRTVEEVLSCSSLNSFQETETFLSEEEELLNMESARFCWVWTCLLLLTGPCGSTTHSEHIHDVRSHGAACSESSKWSLSSAQPGSPDVYDQLWLENENLAQQTLDLPFLQHMQLGDLQADRYASFLIQDIWYLAKVTDLLKSAVQKQQEEDLKAFLEKKYQSYKSFTTKMLQSFNLNSVKDIKAVIEMQNYLEEYQRVLDHEKPIMMAVSLLRLWVWLARELRLGYGNAYWTWKSENMDGNPGKFRDLLNKHLQEEKDVQQAKKIFRTQMQNEFNFFKMSLDK